MGSTVARILGKSFRTGVPFVPSASSVGLRSPSGGGRAVIDYRISWVITEYKETAGSWVVVTVVITLASVVILSP